MTAMTALRNARLPRWALPRDWPETAGEPVLANIDIADGLIVALTPATQPTKGDDLAGCLVLPGLVDAHTHLDKTFTRQRLGKLQPGLLNAIEAMKADQALWSEDDLTKRMEQAIAEAVDQGVTLLRSHIDWQTPTPPTAWQVLADLAKKWRHQIRIQRVALLPLPLLAQRADIETIARAIQASDEAIMGGFIHSSNFNERAIHQLVAVAQQYRLDLDLHIDEELNPQAQGLSCLLDALEKIQFTGRVVCGHECALSQQTEAEALALLDRVAQQPITLVALPATNLLLQDAVTGRTPRQRGLTLLHEARARGIAVMIASDNVQDAFCAIGQYDPIEALKLGVYSAHLTEVFDDWSQAVCRADWLGEPESPFNLIGKAAHFTLFDSTAPQCWPNGEARLQMRHGEWQPANKKTCKSLLYPTQRSAT